jgi:hypothetical protein
MQQYISQKLPQIEHLQCSPLSTSPPHNHLLRTKKLPKTPPLNTPRLLLHLPPLHLHLPLHLPIPHHQLLRLLHNPIAKTLVDAAEYSYIYIPVSENFYIFLYFIYIYIFCLPGIAKIEKRRESE